MKPVIVSTSIPFDCFGASVPMDKYAPNLGSKLRTQIHILFRLLIEGKQNKPKPCDSHPRDKMTLQGNAFFAQ